MSRIGQTALTEASRTNGSDRSVHVHTLATKDVSVFYGDHRALQGASLSFDAGTVTALIGPSGCGKSTYLRSLNLMNREVPGCTVEGSILYHGQEVNDGSVDSFALRRHVGMVFQQPNPFRMSIYDNVAFAPKRHGVKGKQDLDELVEKSLRDAALWDEVKDKLATSALALSGGQQQRLCIARAMALRPDVLLMDEPLRDAALWDEVKDKLATSALALSGGQQQRLCIARAMALRPDVLLMDEPCSALDPIATLAIEDTVRSLAAQGICVAMVTHNMQQAARVSDKCAFFYLGELVETAPTQGFFDNPRDPRTQDYLSGRVG